MKVEEGIGGINGNIKNIIKMKKTNVITRNQVKGGKDILGFINKI